MNNSCYFCENLWRMLHWVWFSCLPWNFPPSKLLSYLFFSYWNKKMSNYYCLCNGRRVSHSHFVTFIPSSHFAPSGPSLLALVWKMTLMWTIKENCTETLKKWHRPSESSVSKPSTAAIYSFLWKLQLYWFYR